MWSKNIAGRFFGLVTKHVCVRQTAGQNYDSQDRASIAASRAKNGRTNIVFTEATVLKTTEAAVSVASNVATALMSGMKCCDCRPVSG